MASWTVFEPERTTPGNLAAADRSVFVKDGFNLAAFLIAPVWLLWRRMWLVFLFWLAAEIALAVIGRLLHFDETLRGVIALLFSLCASLEANALRAWTLRRKGWRFKGLAVGHNLPEAELRHFAERNLVEPAPPAPTRPRTPPPGPSRPHEGHAGVLGVFPQPEGPRS